MQRKLYLLDGLRGMLAIIVVAYHILQFFYSSTARLPLHHAYLAVDFFFLLSGYVIGNAYDHRWTSMGRKEFFSIRLKRLHPLALAGLVLGLVAFVLTTDNGMGLSPALLCLMVIMHALLLPYSGLPNSWDQTHALNGPTWSLFQEYLVNIAYAIIGHKLSNKILGLLVIFSAALLTFGAVRLNTLNIGWDWSNFTMGPVRAFFSFFAGLLIFRSGFRLAVPFAFPILVSGLLLIILFPIVPWNGIFEAFCVVILFPLFLTIGTGSKQDGSWKRLCIFSGEISYPLYILHAPLLTVFGSWVYAGQHPVFMLKIVALSVLAGCLLLSWIFLQYFDKPVRAWLNDKSKTRIHLPTIFARIFGQPSSQKAGNVHRLKPNFPA